MLFRAKRMCLVSLIAASVICNQIDAFSYHDDEGCTAEGKNGNCIPVTECEFAIDIIKQTGIRSMEAQKFLKQQRCGFKDKTPNVCCPEKKDAVDNRNTLELRGNLIEDSNKNSSDSTELPYQNSFTLLPSECKVHLSNRILGGEVAKLREFPWMAALEYQEVDNTEPIIACGGSLISRRYVLTAAHCIRTTSNVRLTNVRLGEYKISTDRDCVKEGNGRSTCADAIISVRIEQSIVHEYFMRPKLYRNDIGLLRLAHDVPITEYIKPICLPSTSHTGKLFWSAGWGQTETKRNSDVKLKVQLPFYDFNKCAAKYASQKVILGKGQMCAGGLAAKDTCRGDSGTPLMRQVHQNGVNDLWIIEGVLSLGMHHCGDADWPAIYTKVYEYLPWILSKLKP